MARAVRLARLARYKRVTSPNSWRASPNSCLFSHKNYSIYSISVIFDRDRQKTEHKISCWEMVIFYLLNWLAKFAIKLTH